MKLYILTKICSDNQKDCFALWAKIARGEVVSIHVTLDEAKSAALQFINDHRFSFDIDRLISDDTPIYSLDWQHNEPQTTWHTWCHNYIFNIHEVDVEGLQLIPVYHVPIMIFTNDC